MDSETYLAGLYYRLSKDDDKDGESISIGTQRAILREYCMEHGYKIYREYVDDGYSGLNFERPGFKEMLKDVLSGSINMVITKDLSRLGRDYIMTGYYSEIFFQSQGVRYIAIADNYDSEQGQNDLAPFKNILNEMYARDISKKVKSAKYQRAKRGLFIGAQAPYGYKKEHGADGCHLAIDEEAASVVKRIYALAEKGWGDQAIASALEQQKVLSPSMYLFNKGNMRFSNSASVKGGKPFLWSYSMVNKILSNRIYLGELTSLKTEVVNYKTKQRLNVPEQRRIVTRYAHPPIISEEQFDAVQREKRKHRCPAKQSRANLFRGLLVCSYCGHPLTIARKQLLYKEEDIYFCSNHFRHPDQCPKTHRIYHEMLYSYVLQQILYFARSMKKRKVNAPVTEYTEIEELTPEILQDVIKQIAIGHVTGKSRAGSVIDIVWKFN